MSTIEQQMHDRKQRDVDAYLDTLARMEPDLHPVDASAFYASAAISLKRLADSFEKIERHLDAIVAEKGIPF